VTKRKPPPQAAYIPSNSTNASGAGAFVSVIIIYILSLKGIFLPAGVESAVTGLLTVLAGYIPKSGRRHDGDKC